MRIRFIELSYTIESTVYIDKEAALEEHDVVSHVTPHLAGMYYNPFPLDDVHDPDEMHTNPVNINYYSRMIYFGTAGSIGVFVRRELLYAY